MQGRDYISLDVQQSNPAPCQPGQWQGSRPRIDASICSQMQQPQHQQQQQPLHQQPNLPTQQHESRQQAPGMSPQKQQQPTQQQLQQYWLQGQGVQQSMDELASFVDALASAGAKSALALHQATWQEKQQLEVIVKQQAARLQQQAAELDVLRGLARQQANQQQQQQQQQQPSAQYGTAQTISSSSGQDSRLQRQLEFHQQEVAAWYKKCSTEKEGRLMAEGALHDTLGIVEQLEHECAGISSMLRDVIAVEAEAAAAVEAAAKNKQTRMGLGLRMTRLGLAVQISAAVFVAGCVGVASAYIALGIRGC